MLHNHRSAAPYKKPSRRFARKLEQPLFWHCPCVAEFYNTLSNFPFIVIGLLRLYNYDALTEFPSEPLEKLYWMMVAAGIGSAIHHATVPSWTIVIDWVPILASSGYCLYLGVLPFISCTTWFKIGLSFLVLFDDHIITRIPVPWGHVMWHVLAAFSVDSIYQDCVKELS